MQPITRETIIDRRQPFVRWSAVFAGALVAGGLWLLFQLLFTGAAMSAIDPEEVEHVRAFGVGASVSSMLAPIIAMFLGGLLAGRLVSHFDKYRTSDRKIVGLHGVLVWALASVVGFIATATAVSHLTTRPAMNHANAHLAASAPSPGAGDFIDESVRNVNTQLKAANAPQITKDDVIEAARGAVTPQNTIDRGSFIARLDDTTELSRPEAEAAVTALGERTPDVVAHANRIAQHREQALEAAEDTGCAMLLAGVGLLLCLGAAIGGSLVSRRFRRTYDDLTREPTHTTAPYPVQTGPVVETRNMPID